MTSILKVDSIQNTSGTTAISGAGKILQVKYAQTTAFVGYNLSFVEVLSQNITPSATSSLILIQSTIATYHAVVGQHAAKLVKDNSALNYEVGDFYHNVGSGVAGNINIQCIDVANTTNAINYKIFVKAESGSGSHGINKDYSGAVNGVTSLVLMEIGV